MTEGYVGDGETLPTTSEEALELISGFISVIDESDEREDLGFAINILANLIRKDAEHVCEPVLEWGEPGDCLDRLENDPDYEDDPDFITLRDAVYGRDKWGGQLMPSREDYDNLIAYAKEQGYGEHYGDPHCIWCLRGD